MELNKNTAEPVPFRSVWRGAGRGVNNSITPATFGPFNGILARLNPVNCSSRLRADFVMAFTLWSREGRLVNKRFTKKNTLLRTQ